MTVDCLAPLRLPAGGFGLVALDQRQSLRDMISRPGVVARDSDVRDFKIAAIRALAPYAPAILIDRHYGLDPSGSPITKLPERTALILAADHFDQPPGGPVRNSFLDPAVTPKLIATSGARALKLYVIWRRSDASGERDRTVDRYLRLCRATGIPGIVEGVTRPDGERWASSDERDQAIVDAATEFALHGPDLYKAEVPDHGIHREIVTRRSAEITSVLECPWVVLSTGVAPEAFGDAVAAACRGGAGGFLAGRAIWSAATVAADRDAALQGQAVARLRDLIARVKSVVANGADESRLQNDSAFTDLDVAEP